MAIEHRVNSDIGMVFERAYVRIHEYRCAHTNNVDFVLRAYVTRERFLEGAAHISGSETWIPFTAEFNDSSVNTKKQIYRHMATMDDYKNAKPVLEEGQSL
ncbi:hypothetical protein [Shouchella patagoniensis]|uniref:hypothetical protein n=1 Tax=Shouchella patagoniensis TaxID=228576 RepID=UPI0009950988|nr:hypothetical protein [Shouchella patagoniensis]